LPTEEDESNLINKEDFEDGKTKAIITSRDTPIKSNTMARKNMSTARKQYGHSPALRGALEFRDPSNPGQVYYQILSSSHREGNNFEGQSDCADPGHSGAPDQMAT
jgi:hypothetical protein